MSISTRLDSISCNETTLNPRQLRGFADLTDSAFRMDLPRSARSCWTPLVWSAVWSYSQSTHIL